jgi:hypothetical protein
MVQPKRTIKNLRSLAEPKIGMKVRPLVGKLYAIMC